MRKIKGLFSSLKISDILLLITHSAKLSCLFDNEYGNNGECAGKMDKCDLPGIFSNSKQ